MSPSAIPFFAAFAPMLRAGLDASGVALGELGRRAWLPVYAPALLLACVLFLRWAPKGLGRIESISNSPNGVYRVEFWSPSIFSGPTSA